MMWLIFFGLVDGTMPNFLKKVRGFAEEIIKRCIRRGGGSSSGGNGALVGEKVKHAHLLGKRSMIGLPAIMTSLWSCRPSLPTAPQSRSLRTSCVVALQLGLSLPCRLSEHARLVDDFPEKYSAG